MVFSIFDRTTKDKKKEEKKDIESSIESQEQEDSFLETEIDDVFDEEYYSEVLIKTIESLESFGKKMIYNTTFYYDKYKNVFSHEIPNMTLELTNEDHYVERGI